MAGIYTCRLKSRVWSGPGSSFWIIDKVKALFSTAIVKTTVTWRIPVCRSRLVAEAATILSSMTSRASILVGWVAPNNTALTGLVLITGVPVAVPKHPAGKPVLGTNCHGGAEDPSLRVSQA